MLKKLEYRRAIRTFVKTYSVCYHILRNTKEDMNMRNVFKMLLVPVWLAIAILKLAFKLVSGVASFVLVIGGGLLFVYDLLLLIIGSGSRELMFKLLVIGALLIGVPLVAGFIVGLLEAAQEPITEFIVS